VVDQWLSQATSSDYATRREPHEASVGEGSLAHLFGVPFLSRVWPDSDELNQDLRRRILARERDATARSVTKSNVGGWQSDSGGLEWCGEAGKVVPLPMWLVPSCARPIQDDAVATTESPVFVRGCGLLAQSRTESEALITIS